MPSFTSLFTSLTGAGFFFEKNSRHATYNFNQDARSLYRNQPRFPFEYYININFNKVDQAAQFYNNFFQSGDNIAPLVKTVEMPSMKIETTPLNQYNRKRLSQTKIAFEPVKMVFHDVADGKTLKFWEMYYRYYFGDGTEPGKNEAKSSQQKNKTFGLETLKKGAQTLIPQINPALANLPDSIKNMFGSNAPSGANSPTNNNGQKSNLSNIVSDTLDSHIFGFNLPQVQNVRNLIQSIDIYQVHGGRMIGVVDFLLALGTPEQPLDTSGEVFIIKAISDIVTIAETITRNGNVKTSNETVTITESITQMNTTPPFKWAPSGTKKAIWQGFEWG